MADEEIARESMEYDVVIVGAGPAGLSAAIRLKQVAPELSVAVLEKGAEVGAHILSGAVIDPCSLNELIPDWKEKGAPLDTPVTDDRFMILGPAGSASLPTFLMPPLMHNHGNYIASLSNFTKWLGGEAEALGVEIYPGMAASEAVFDEHDALKGVVAGVFGVSREGLHKADFQPGMELHGKYVLIAEGVRGSLTKQLFKRYGLDTDCQPQKFGTGIKELWEVPADKHKPGLVLHSVGWPLDDKTGGGSFMYHWGERYVSVGYVVHLNYKNPYLSPFDEFQRHKLHPDIAEHIEGGKRIAYGARAITEGGFQSVPKLVFPGGALIGCAAGFVNVPRIKGSHNAMKTGMLAAEAVAEAIAAGRQRDVLEGYAEAYRESSVWQRSLQGAQRKAALVTPRHLLGRGARHVRNVVNHVAGRVFVLLRHGLAQARQVRRRLHGESRQAQADRLPQTRWRVDVRQAQLGLPLEHQPRGRSAHSPEIARPFDPDRCESS